MRVPDPPGGIRGCVASGTHRGLSTSLAAGCGRGTMLSELAHDAGAATPHASRVRLPELRLIAPGHGATATHSVHYVVCQLGLRAYHTRLNCSSVKVRRQHAANPYLCDVGAAMRHLSRAQRHANTSFENTRHLARHVRAVAQQLIEQVAARRLQAVSDYPVFLFYDELAAAAPGAAVLLSTRNATEWAIKRGSGNPVCRETSLEWPLTTGDGPPLPHPFAFTACAERFLRRRPEQRDSGPAFLTVGDLQSSAHGIRRLAAG